VAVPVRQLESVHRGGSRTLAIVYATISGLVLKFWGGMGAVSGDGWNAFVGGMLIGWILVAVLELRWQSGRDPAAPEHRGQRVGDGLCRMLKHQIHSSILGL